MGEQLSTADQKRLEGDVIAKDITVSRLSRLQKQILIFARRSMLDKNQKIEQVADATLNLPAPAWLGSALTEALKQVFLSRKTFQLDGENDLLGAHEWFRFFEEAAFVERSIVAAAEQAGVKDDIILTRLCDLAMPLEALIALHDLPQRHHPWPYYHDRVGWHFKLTFPGKTVADIKDKQLAHALSEEESRDLWFDPETDYPLNCTIPELLHNLYHFPVRQDQFAHLDGLAFSPKEIGEARYNRAQAALRRACQRLAARKLIGIRKGQSHSLFQHYSIRTGIGLTEQGVAAADALLQGVEANKNGWPNDAHASPVDVFVADCSRRA